MMSWKFLLIGITGDLAKRKILPALSQFSSLYKDQVQIELIGYSRSKPEETEIKQILGNHNLANISFVQGEYSDPSFFISLFENLKENEKLVAYFAVPPVVFLDLLQTFCPFNAKNLDILIEKPFGRDFDEAKLILKKVHDCRLENNVHFCDHYLFKTALDLNEENKLKIRKFISNTSIKEITISALETLGVNGRAGYYDQIGALKDMLPAHLYSFWNYIQEEILNEKVELDIEELKIGQYKNYRNDVDNPNSNTETCFEIYFKSEKSFNLIMKSGKKLERKLNEIKISLENGNEIIWNIDPDKSLTFIVAGQSEVLSLGAESQLDHTRMFEDIMTRQTRRFFNGENTILGWDFYNKVIEYKVVNNCSLKEY